MAAILGDARNELHVLQVDGSPAGFAELDRRQPGEIELVQLGLMAEFMGQGLGKWFLQWTIDKARSYQPRRLWLHTCSLDPPPHQIEGNADKLMLQLMRDLYGGAHQPLKALVLKDLYEMMEKIIDRTRDAGNVLYRLVLKYS